MMTEGGVGVVPLKGKFVIFLIRILSFPVRGYICLIWIFVLSASPVRRSLSPLRSLSPRRTPPSRDQSPVKRSPAEQSPPSRSVSPRRRRADSRSPSPRSSDEVFYLFMIIFFFLYSIFCIFLGVTHNISFIIAWQD